MTTEKIVMNALFGKTKLSSKKVELGIADDIAKAATEANALLTILKNDNANLIQTDNAISAALAAAQKIKAEAIKNISKGQALLGKITPLLSKAEVAAKDLGLDVKSIAGYKELSNLFDRVEVYSEEDFGVFKNIK
jgi:hypothetical protein